MSNYMKTAREDLEYDIENNIGYIVTADIETHLRDLISAGREDLYESSLEDYEETVRITRDNIVDVAEFLIDQPENIRNLKQYRYLAKLLVEYIDYYYAACDKLSLLDVTAEFGDLADALWNNWFDRFDIYYNAYDSGNLGRKLIALYNIEF